jgi:hypothetical protein
MGSLNLVYHALLTMNKDLLKADCLDCLLGGNDLTRKALNRFLSINRAKLRYGDYEHKLELQTFSGPSIAKPPDVEFFIDSIAKPIISSDFAK